MSETLRQKRVRKMRDRAIRKKHLAATKKKFKDDRELTLHEAHQMTVLCRRRHKERKMRGFSRFEKVIDLDELVFDPNEVEEYYGVGFHLVG